MRDDDQSLRRPRPAVPAREKRFVGREVADVHGRRDDVPLLAPDLGLLALAERLTPSVYVDLGRPCNSACLYCAVPPHEDAQGFLPAAEVPAIVAAGRDAGCDRAILVGGEPTIHPQLWEVLAACRDGGLDGGQIVMTNGLRLGREGFVRQLAEAGVGTLHVSIDTADAGVYDRLSRSSGRFAQQREGLDAALAESGVWTYVYTAVTALNAPGLPALAEMLAAAAERAGRAPPVWVLAAIKPLGDGLRHADQLLLAPDVMVQTLGAAVRRAQALGVPVGLRNLQACLMPEWVPLLVDYYLDDFSVELQSGRRVRFSHHEYWSKPSERCGRCGHEALCTGIYAETRRRYGEQAFAPIARQGLRNLEDA